MDDQNRENKREYLRRFDIVQGIINKWDPIGLFPGDGAPFDEYEPEIAQIVALLDKSPHDVSLTAECIYKVLIDWFGDDSAHYFPIESCRSIAARIWQAIDYGKLRD